MGVALVLLIFVLVSCTSGSAGSDPNIELIDEYAKAWYEGDYTTALEIRGLDPETHQPLIDWMQYEVLVDPQVDIECEHDAAENSVYNCALTYSNALHEAVDAEPIVREWRGRVIEGRIEIVDYDRSPSPVETSWVQWAAADGPAENPCDPSLPPSPNCARFQLAHLEEWAAWHRAEQVGS